MSFWKKIFKPTTVFPNLLAESYPEIKFLEDEQERTFEGMIQIFCEDKGLPFEKVDKEYRFKARIIGGVLVPFSYAACGHDESGYVSLMNLAFNTAVTDRDGVKLYSDNTALMIGSRFIDQNMTNIAEDYRAGRGVLLFSRILFELLDECTLNTYKTKFDIERYEHFVVGNLNIVINRATELFKSRR